MGKKRENAPESERAIKNRLSALFNATPRRWTTTTR
jgi:hypothetical protein